MDGHLQSKLARLMRTELRHAATLTLNAPDKLNAVSRKMIAELKDCWEKLGADSSVRAVLLTGAGRGFCAGFVCRLSGQRQRM